MDSANQLRTADYLRAATGRVVRFICFGLLFFISACSLFQARGPQLQGAWQGDLQGFPVLLVYSADSVSVNGGEPVPYSHDAGWVTLATDDQRRYRVEFPSNDEMVQVDVLTGVRQIYRRVD